MTLLVTNKIKVSSVEDKVKLIREVVGGKKTAVCREFCLVNYKIQISRKTEQIISAFEQNGSRMRYFET